MPGVGHDTADRLGRALTDSGSVGHVYARATGLGRKADHTNAHHFHRVGFHACRGSELHDGLALRSLVGNRREYAQTGKRLRVDSLHGIEFRGLTVADRDGSGLVEQQRIEVSGRFDGLARLGNDIGAQRAVHAGDTDRREQAADRSRNQADEQRDESGYRDVGSHVIRKRLQRSANDHEYQRESGQQNRQSDFVRSFLTGRTFDQRDHLVEEAFARLGGYLDDDPVRQYFRTARHGTLVSARFADHRSRLARDGALVDRGKALDDLAVGRNRISCGAFEHIALFQLRAADHFRGTVGRYQLGRSLLAGLAQALGLRLAARFGDRFGEIGEQNRQQQHEEDRQIVPERTLRLVSREGDVEQHQQHDGGHQFHGEHDRVLDHGPRIELAERLHEARIYQLFVEQRIIFLFHGQSVIRNLNNQRSGPEPVPGRTKERPR